MDVKTIHRRVRRGFITFAITSTALLLWCVQERGVPDAWFESDADVRVTRTEYGRLFMPATGAHPAAAVLFLPGGLVDPDAYVPLVRGLALEGFAAALVELPWRSAPTPGTEQTLWARIRDARAALAGSRIVLAGHSRGGMFASTFAADNPAAIDALVLVGTTHPRDRDLSGGTWPVLKVLGSEDCVASVPAARANAAMLPASTQWVEMAGANHRQFAYYGWQLGDCDATISREQQHRRTIAAITTFLAGLTR